MANASPILQVFTPFFVTQIVFTICTVEKPKSNHCSTGRKPRLKQADFNGMGTATAYFLLLSICKVYRYLSLLHSCSPCLVPL